MVHPRESRWPGWIQSAKRGRPWCDIFLTTPGQYRDIRVRKISEKSGSHEFPEYRGGVDGQQTMCTRLKEGAGFRGALSEQDISGVEFHIFRTNAIGLIVALLVSLWL